MGRPSKYPFADMAVGEERVVQLWDAAQLGSLRTAAVRYGARHGRRYRVARIGKPRSPVTAARVWRLADPAIDTNLAPAV